MSYKNFDRILGRYYDSEPYNCWRCDPIKYEITPICNELKNPIKTLEWKQSLSNPDIYELEIGERYVWKISAYDISKIYRNSAKRTVVVEWATGHKTKVKCADDDADNIFFAVAAAVMKRKYGSNSAFKRRIERNLGLYSDRAYKHISVWETCEIYGGHEKFIDVVNSKVARSHSKEKKHEAGKES